MSLSRVTTKRRHCIFLTINQTSLSTTGQGKATTTKTKTMAASSSTPFFSASGVPDIQVQVSQEEFKLFHSIDRKLFSRLVFALGRDPGESAQVMALWMWLEHAGKEINFVHKICVNLSNTLLNGIADESVMALTFIQSDHFPEFNANYDIPLLHALTKNNTTLQFFHQNRLGIVRAVTQLFNEVCMRAFDDLFPKPRDYSQNYMHGVDVINHQQYFVGPHHHHHPTTSETARWTGSLDYLRGVFDGARYDLGVQRQILNNEMSDILGRLNLNDLDENPDHQEDVDQVAAYERTIFLTFSKGYLISETEVREFFSRKFGDFIEDVFMQEVPAEEQPLYARLVVRSASSIPIVLDGKSKAKFSINGKHVWARKYVRKNSKSPSRSPEEPSSPKAAAPTQT